MLSYFLIHPIKFSRTNLVETIRETIRNEKWESNYCRNLVASEIKRSDLLDHKDHTGRFTGCIWQLTIENRRKDRAAVNTIAILNSVEGRDIPFLDSSYLKWTDQMEGYEHTILPESHAAFDIFALHVGEGGIFLLSRRDFSPRSPVIEDAGEYVFNFHVYAADFPLLKVPVKIYYTGDVSPSVAEILEN